MNAKANLVLIPLVAAMFAGCVASDGGASESATGAEPQTQSGPASFDETTGAITGLITDEEYRAIGGAQIAIVDVSPAIVVLSDPAGAFSFSNVAPGTHNIAAQKLGYESIARIVEVVAGQETQIDITLAVLPVEEAYYEIIPHNGIIPNGFGLVRTALTIGGGTNETSYLLWGGLPDDFVGMVIEARWETQDVLGFDLVDRDVPGAVYWRNREPSGFRHFVQPCTEEYIGAPWFGRIPMPCGEDEYKDGQGNSANDMHWETWYIGQFTEQTALLNPVCQTPIPGVLPGYEAGCYGAGVAIDFQWETRLTVFHYELIAGAEGFSAWPDA